MVARALLLAVVAAPALVFAQADFRVYIDHPRLFLDPDRLRRLERDAQRETARWLRLKEMHDLGAPLEDKPATEALLWRLEGNEAAADAAIDWALEAARRGFEARGELRQGALVFDWLQPRLDPDQRAALIEGLAAGAERSTALAGSDVAGVRDGVLAAIALAGHWDGSEPTLGALLSNQWEREIAPLLKAGQLTDNGEELVAVLEICHVIRLNLERDLWQETPAVFRSLPMARILAYLPGAELSDEGRLRRRAVGENSHRELALARIAEMLLVAYEIGLREFQFLQGWLRNDSYTLTGPLGAFYELVWVNPYIPGLSPTSGPVAAYDAVRGRVFARRSWDDGAFWLGWFDGQLRLRENGEKRPIGPAKNPKAFPLPGSAVVLGGMEGKTDLTIPQGGLPSSPRIWIVGLVEGMQYPIKVGKGDFEMFTARRGGIVELRNQPDARKATLEYDKKIRLQLRAGSAAPSGPAPTLGPKR